MLAYLLAGILEAPSSWWWSPEPKYEGGGRSGTHPHHWCQANVQVSLKMLSSNSSRQAPGRCSVLHCQALLLVSCLHVHSDIVVLLANSKLFHGVIEKLVRLKYGLGLVHSLHSQVSSCKSLSAKITAASVQGVSCFGLQQQQPSLYPCSLPATILSLFICALPQSLAVNFITE